ncbi:hypothetical protein D9611_011795 [Ephemerocybe angulata]|uniref:Alpha-type protein kinase domain-containing protein n=1 Tax=Ephemerocybe angulata TaxID=980116 RepID=A0A8H5B772_9AGAR|nr:hypothetical protein D9611_015166 [Tulosesus angulatus]KAF5328296.1 hypothetical protein D9611_015164 [Tulosesus angulatus]KAF5335303.1 hypothetical protein D9611_011795 [Tulosesus angulatus]
MLHSPEQSYGLGDDDWSGIESFVDQHKCNSICRALDLPDVDSLWEEFGPDSDSSNLASVKIEVQIQETPENDGAHGDAE